MVTETIPQLKSFSREKKRRLISELLDEVYGERELAGALAARVAHARRKPGSVNSGADESAVTWQEMMEVVLLSGADADVAGLHPRLPGFAEDLFQAGGNSGGAFRVEPGALDPKAPDRRGLNARCAGRKFDEQIAFTAEKTVCEFLRVEHPVFLHAVKFVGGKLRAEVVFRRAGREDFDAEHRRHADVGPGKLRDLVRRVKTKVGHEGLARAEADGDLLAMQLSGRVGGVKKGAEQTIHEIHEVGVAEIDWRVHVDFSRDEVGPDTRLEPVEKLFGGLEWPGRRKLCR